MKNRVRPNFLFLTATALLFSSCFPEHFDSPPEPKRPPEIIKHNQEKRKGKCDVFDEKLYVNNVEFAPVWRKCGRKAMADSGETASCIRQNFGLTGRCASCFGDFAACGREHCTRFCWWSDTEECKECSRNHCSNQWARCSGSKASELPR